MPSTVDKVYLACSSHMHCMQNSAGAGAARSEKTVHTESEGTPDSEKYG